MKYNPFGIRLSEGAVEMIRVLMTAQGVSGLSFLELYRILRVYLDPNMRFYEIEGGNDRLPRALSARLKEHIMFGQKMDCIRCDPDRVTIRTVSTKTRKHASYQGDYAIITIPFSALRLVKVVPYHAFSHHKRKAIRELHYVAATKIGVEFKSRFWEKEGIRGGQTVTDLPSRLTHYPSHGIGSKGPAVILASYTWENDTLVWDSQPEEERLRQVLCNLAAIHGDVVYREAVTGISKSWRQDPYIAGDFVVFKPGQESALAPYLATPEGRVHFAGEHTSTHRVWIEGAVESGIRAAYEVQRISR